MAVFGRSWGENQDEWENLTFNLPKTNTDTRRLKELMGMNNNEEKLLDNFYKELDVDQAKIAKAIEKTSVNAFDKQCAGNHYKSMKIQPMEFALANNLNYGQANAIKYICRYEHKNGLEDLRKAIHCIELLIEYKYGDS